MTLPTSSAFSGPAERKAPPYRCPRHLGDAGEIGRLIAGVDSVGAKAFHEAPQPEALEIERVWPQAGSGFFGDFIGGLLGADMWQLQNVIAVG